MSAKPLSPILQRMRDVPIRQKLLISLIGVAAVALFVSSVLEGFARWDIHRSDVMKRLEITAEGIALQSRPALQFIDAKAAHENLLSLRADPAIAQACLYDDHHVIFASYQANKKAGAVTCNENEKEQFQLRRLSLFKTIEADGHSLGGIYIEYDLSAMYVHFAKEMLVKLLIILMVLAAVWPLSNHLQSIISNPIVELANIARLFSKTRKRPVYATKLADDELGELVDVFNQMMHDISANEDQLGRMITEMRQAKEGAESANATKGEFLANMSHEIRTPLNVVIGLSHILSITQPLTPKQKELIHTLRLSGDSLLSLVNDLLDFAKFEDGGITLEHVEFNLVEIVNKVLSIMLMRAQEKNLQLLFDSAGLKHSHYMGDPLRVQQILTNLISNAIKFTENGYVKVTLTDELLPEKDMAEITMTVADSGIGIPSDKLATIFDKFTQADASTTRKYGGTGLGLAICRSLVKFMDGTIDVSSKRAEGSVFTVRLPMLRTIGTAGTVPAMPEFSASPPMKDLKNTVLLVEDHQPNILVASSMLEQLGYPHHVARSGTEAIAKFQHQRYCLILMDIQIPIMDGIETTRRIRALESAKGQAATPIIAMTAFALSGDRERFLKAGMNDYIAKPFEPALLQQKITHFVAHGIKGTKADN